MDALTHAGRVILRWRLTLAHYLDRFEAKVRRLGEKLGWPQKWLAEFIAFRGDPRMTIEEFWCRFTLLRMDAEAKWFQPKMSEAEARRFYEKHNYMLWRNLVHRRHSAWRRVLVTMASPYGWLLEYGCGVAPVSAWLQSHRRWRYVVEDLPSAHLKFALWRVEGAGINRGFTYTVVTALDVFEHLADPVMHAEVLVKVLRPGGYLHYNIHFNPSANDLDLATEEQLHATARYLESVLDVVWTKDEYRVGRKPEVPVHARPPG